MPDAFPLLRCIVRSDRRFSPFETLTACLRISKFLLSPISVDLVFSEAELSNLHLNNIENGFLPVAMVNFNNGVPAPEERQTIEALLESKFTGTRNAGRFMVSFNDEAINKPTIDTLPMENLHEKYQYVAEYAQDRILVAHRIVSPLLFGIRTANNGFSSQSEEMKTAYSIMQTMTIFPFQNLLINHLYKAFRVGGIDISELYFEQLTPLVILSTTAEETDSTVEEVQETIDDNLQGREGEEKETEQKRTRHTNTKLGNTWEHMKKPCGGAIPKAENRYNMI